MRKDPKVTPYPPEVAVLLEESSRLHDEAETLLWESGKKEGAAMAIIFAMAEPLLGLSADKMSHSLTWGCPGPLGVCIFNEEEDSCRDNCLFCHQPVERK
jgi:hypothetical protein